MIKAGLSEKYKTLPWWLPAGRAGLAARSRKRSRLPRPTAPTYEASASSPPEDLRTPASNSGSTSAISPRRVVLRPATAADKPTLAPLPDPRPRSAETPPVPKATDAYLRGLFRSAVVPAPVSAVPSRSSFASG